jgi:hypothetical protein
MQYELCNHGKCTTYPGWHKCEKCEEELRRLLAKTKRGTKLYHALRYAVSRMS